jgi:hypothetical protein
MQTVCNRTIDIVSRICKFSNTQKTVVEDGVNKLPEAAKEERKKIVSNSTSVC